MRVRTGRRIKAGDLEEGRVMTDAEAAAAQSAIREEIVRKRSNGPCAALAALALGTSVLFTQYAHTGALSATLAYMRNKIGFRFRCRLERDPVYGDIEGVRVTRIE